MRFANHDRGFGDYDDGPEIPDDYIHQDNVLEWVFENERDAIEETVRADVAAEWLRNGKSWLELLNVVSRHDKEQLRQALRNEVKSGGTLSSEQIDEAQLFAVASDAARLLESASLPYSEFCSPSEDLTWASKLIRLTRAFREILFLISEPDDSWTVNHHLSTPIEEINSAIIEGRPDELVFQGHGSKGREFHCKVNPSLTPLHSHLAIWIREFLVSHRASLPLGACTECGTIFSRERRDNVYCSKACQNRVAYKRKKIFESGVLVEEEVDPGSPSNVRAGMWINHPRLGLGRVEGVRFTDRRVWVQFRNYGSGERIPDGATAEQVLDKIREARKETPISWEEIVDPESLELRVRFLQIARTFRAWEVFPRGKKRDNSPTFYRVTNAKTLSDLL